jgi:hypothetical protein
VSPTPPPLKLVALLILGGAGLGLVAAGVTTAWGWKQFVPGFVAVLISLSAVWVIHKTRDKTLR